MREKELHFNAVDMGYGPERAEAWKEYRRERRHRHRRLANYEATMKVVNKKGTPALTQRGRKCGDRNEDVKALAEQCRRKYGDEQNDSHRQRQRYEMMKETVKEVQSKGEDKCPLRKALDKRRLSPTWS